MKRKLWALPLTIALALFDIFGEFAAQGTFIILITVSFLIAVVLLLTTLYYWRFVSDESDVSSA